MSPTVRPLPRLSVAMIVRDAEALIAPTLDSIRAIADEIVIADTGSTDRTPGIIAKRATKPLACNWVNDFSAARNFCLPHLSGDWVLWLDAGEVLSPNSAAELRNWIDRTATHQAGAVNVQQPAESQELAGEQALRVRLLPNHPGMRFVGRVRETIVPALAAANISVQSLDICLVRPRSDQSPAVKNAKARRDLRLADLELRELGSLPRVLNVLGEAFSTLGEPAKGSDCFRRAILNSPRESTEMLEAYYGLLATLDHQPDQTEAQMAVCVEALEIFPTDAQLLCAMGTYLQKQGRLDLAARAYQSAVQHGSVNPALWHLTHLRELAATSLSYTLQQQSRDDEARKVLETALAENPHWVRVRRQMIDLHVKHHRRKEALEQVNLLPPETPYRESLRTAVRGACYAARQDWASALPFLNAAFAGGCRDTLCVRWLTLACVATGQYASAAPILEAWLATDPHSVEANHYRALLANRRVNTCPAPLPGDASHRFDAPHVTINSREMTAPISTLTGELR